MQEQVTSKPFTRCQRCLRQFKHPKTVPYGPKCGKIVKAREEAAKLEENMGFMLDQAGEKIRLTITGKEGFSALTAADGTIILEGPAGGFAFLGQMLGEEFAEEDE